MSLRADWVDAIFERLAVRYGAAFANAYPGIDPAAVKADWATVLHGATPRTIKHALEAMASDRPPNAAQFRALCLSAPPEPRKALPAPDSVKADPQRVAAILAAVRREPRTVAEVAKAVFAGLRQLRDDGKASPAQLDFLDRAEAGMAAPTMQSLGGFTPIDISSWPPGMRAEAEAGRIERIAA